MARPRTTTKAAIVEFYTNVPNDVDLAYWKQREKDIIFEAGALCDGQTIWYYHHKPQVMRPDQPYSSQLESVTSQAVTGAADDPMMPWPHLMPEQLSHPSVYVPDSDREFFLDPKPTDGPPNTVRLRVRNSRSKDPNRPDLYRLWVDPEKNYLSFTSETSVFDGGNIQGKIAFVDTYTLADVARSPNGSGTRRGCCARHRISRANRSLGSSSTSERSPTASFNTKSEFHLARMTCQCAARFIIAPDFRGGMPPWADENRA